MLYTYQHITHNFDKIHQFIEHLVLEVWCKPSGAYSIKKLHPDFIPIVEGVNAKYLKSPIRSIYNICAGLTAPQRLRLKNGFKANNAIEELCKGNNTPLLYTEIGVFSVPLKNKLAVFFKNLYSKVPLRAAFKIVCGDIDDYYDGLVGTYEKCPFCGISDILTPRHTKRDALDHYLPKDTYPFNSVNPENLAPICKTCNTSYKGTNSPILGKNGSRRKAFYPFAKKAAKLDIKLKFKCVNILNAKKDDVELKVSNKRFKEEIETWMELFGIEERYSIKFSSKDAKAWLETMLIDFKCNPKTKNKSFTQKMQYFEQNLIEDNNFLKIPYFNTCQKMGIL